MVGLSALRKLREVDRLVLVPLLLLLLCGFFLIDAASQDAALSFPLIQLRWVLLALAVAVPLVLVPYPHLLRYAPLLYALFLLLLVLVRAVGPVINGAQRWLVTPLGSIQPSEFMKFVTVMLLARMLRFGRVLDRPVQWVRPLLVAMIPMGLILVQPDLGTSMLFVPVAVAVVLVSGIPLRSLLLLFVLGVAVLLGSYGLLLKPYQKERILSTFRHDELTSHQLAATGYQLRQSLITIGNGGLVGHGHLEGPRTQAGRVPYQHNDFIFAVLAEEHGFAGAVAVLLLVLLLAVAVVRVALRSRDPAGRLLCVGIGTLFFSQAMVHAGVTLGLVPTTGMPFPLLSYGGSTTLAYICGLALVLNVSIHRPAVLISTTGPPGF